ncbi:hypothetical protein BCR33DRAFT_738613 [Rhizoclosmatium globosum]|uniref:50S ribosomal protein L35 n=1 Tax=Rhizoclosmatium globosum TaxID=329046 RepID=A0A1Y2C8G5_9FUNG|nr:hypothetical protein BCR33DRAFT_738613 [Rhizoclosmatium globosum]|eukprot:ORY43322.1 hypothetical protein BCR33DRAFT_738613 [Rhizoclosmatium globosum]
MAGLQRGFSVLSLAASHSHPTLTATQTRSFPFAAVAIASQIRGNAGTKKKKLSAVVLRNEVKVASKRKGKHYKLKNHRGALTRWLIKSPSYKRGPVFKRAQAGTSHLNRKNRSWKTRSKRRRVEANAQQTKLLRRLIPYHRKKYMR